MALEGLHQAAHLVLDQRRAVEHQEHRQALVRARLRVRQWRVDVREAHQAVAAGRAEQHALEVDAVLLLQHARDVAEADRIAALLQDAGGIHGSGGDLVHSVGDGAVVEERARQLEHELLLDLLVVLVCEDDVVLVQLAQVRLLLLHQALQGGEDVLGSHRLIRADGLQEVLDVEVILRSTRWKAPTSTFSPYLDSWLSKYSRRRCISSQRRM